MRFDLLLGAHLFTAVTALLWPLVIPSSDLWMIMTVWTAEWVLFPGGCLVWTRITGREVQLSKGMASVADLMVQWVILPLACIYIFLYDGIFFPTAMILGAASLPGREKAMARAALKGR